MLERYGQVQKVLKSKAVRQDQKWARPNAVTPWIMEIVGEDAQYLYLKNLPIEDPRSPYHKAWLAHEDAEASLYQIAETAETYFIIDPFAELVPPPFSDRLVFEERSAGLPTQGRWQVGFASADMNGDGRLDLVFRPPVSVARCRRSSSAPGPAGAESATVKWPSVRFDYGDVGVADFDGDGNPDIAIACHFLRTTSSTATARATSRASSSCRASTRRSRRARSPSRTSTATSARTSCSSPSSTSRWAPTR